MKNRGRPRPREREGPIACDGRDLVFHIKNDYSIHPAIKRLMTGRRGQLVVRVTIVSISPSGIFDVSTCTLNLIF